MVSILERIGQAADVADGLAAVAQRVRSGVTLIRGRQGMGSGIVWDADGVIVTNSHVVGGDAAEVVLEDGRSFHGRVTARDRRRDLARLEVDGHGLPAVPLGDAGDLKVGQLVIAVGNPNGVRGATTLGIISAIGVKGLPGERRGRRELVQADIALAPGNSGGPLTDAAGRVVGINAMVAGPRVALSIPVHVARAFVAGETPAGTRIGVMGQAAAIPAVFRRAGVEQDVGVILVGIQEDSPAAHAGLLPGDVLLQLDGAELDSPDALLDLLEAHAPGVPLTATVLRGGRLRGITVVPVAA